MLGTSTSFLDTHTQSVADQLVGLQQQLKYWMASQTSKLFATSGDAINKSTLPGLDQGQVLLFTLAYWQCYTLL